MFEAITYDARDKESEYPSSTLGTYDTVEEAWIAVAKYLQGEHTYLAPIYRVEVIRRDRD